MSSIVRAWIRRYLKIAVHPYEGLPLALVSGVGRSGTTAVRKSLSVHPAVHSTGTENNIIYDVLGTALHNCTFPSRKATMHVEQWEYDRHFRLLLLNLLWPAPRRSRPATLLTYSDLLPERAEYLGQVFPGARIVYVVRNGIAVVSSRMSHPNFRPMPFEHHCAVWQQAMAMAEWGRVRNGFVLVRQERLLDPAAVEGVFREVFQCLGLAFHAPCLDVILGERFHPTAFEREQTEASRDLTRRKERWRLWSDAQRATFAHVCGEAMRYFGYEIPWMAHSGKEVAR